MTTSSIADQPGWDQPLRGIWSQIGAAHLLAPLSRAGFDWICLDAQHGRFDDAAVLAGLGELRGENLKKVVRVRSLGGGLIGRALDAGADGVIVPMVDTPEQAAEAVRSSFYPPVGQRSWGPIGGYIGTTAGANDRVLCAVMVETPLALSNVDAIAATPGIGMIFVGPFDLSIALGMDVDDLVADRSPNAPLTKIVKACKDAGIIPGVFAGTPERAVEMEKHGFTFVGVATDALVIARGGEAILA